MTQRLAFSDLNWTPVMKLPESPHSSGLFQPPKFPFLEVTEPTSWPESSEQNILTELRAVSSQMSPQLGSTISWKPVAQEPSGQNSESPQVPQLQPAEGRSSVWAFVIIITNL